jgi:GT2 family glycosyltransferase
VLEREPPAAQVWIVIVNWNRRQDTLACLASVARSTLPAAHVLVVDNGSADGSAEAVRRAWPAVQVLQAGENLGFGRANNLGAERFLQEPTATHLLLLNNDAILTTDALARLVRAAEQGERIAAAAPKIDDAGAISFATGCGLLLKRAAVEQVGLFDPRYFFFGEDVDLSLRLLRAGYEICYCPEAVVLHQVGRSARQLGRAFTYYHMTRNRLLTMRNHAPWYRWVQFGLYFPILWGWQIVRAAARDRNLAVARGIWRGVRDFAAGRFERRGP